VKTVSNYLFDLIHSMSRNEKGYFKKQVLAHARDPEEVQYLKLFDAIEIQEEYDENELLDKFSDEKFTRQLAVAKNYLGFLILKSLIQFHSGKNVESILNRQLDFSLVLFNKGFYKECRAELRRAKKIAQRFDKHDYLLTILNKEKQLIASVKNESMSIDLEELIVEEQWLIENILIESELSLLYYQFLHEMHSSRIKSTEKEIEQLKNLYARVPHGRQHNITFNCKNYLLGIETLYHYLVNNFEKAEDYGRQHCDLWETNPERLADENEMHLEMLYHYISACFQTKNYEEVNRCIEKVKNFNADTSDKMQRRFFIYYSNKLRYCATLALYDETESVLKEIEEKYSSIDQSLSLEYKIVISINCSIAYFVIEKYSNSMRWLNNYLNSISKDFRKDMYSFARTFNLLVHYKLGNMDLLEHILKNTNRELQKHAGCFKYEKVILSFIRKITQQRNKKKIAIHASEVLNSLRELNQLPLERDAMRYFNFSRWIESELQMVPYRKLAEKEMGKA
jgi:hypothetical protein